MSPDEALNESAQILTRHFQQIAKFSGRGGAEGAPPPGLEPPGLPPRVYDTPIEALDLSPRAYNSLMRAGVSTVGKVLEMTGEALLNVRNFGRKSLDELVDRLILYRFITRKRAQEQFGGVYREDDELEKDEE
jgi:DNA-directed RNA polymerase subunit alpha